MERYPATTAAARARTYTCTTRGGSARVVFPPLASSRGSRGGCRHVEGRAREGRRRRRRTRSRHQSPAVASRPQSSARCRGGESLASPRTSGHTSTRAPAHAQSRRCLRSSTCQARAAGAASPACPAAARGQTERARARHEQRRQWRPEREKMTLRRHVVAGLHRALLAAAVLGLLVFALSGQERSGAAVVNPRQAYLSFEDEAAMTLEERLMEQGRLSETGMRMAERRKYLAERCVEEGLDRPGNDSLHRPNAWEFLVNREHHLVWCNVFKAASTSWMYNFNLLAGYSPQFLKASKAVPVSLARQKYPRPTAEELAGYLNDSVSFLIVRHPFERLLSAYRDKLEHSLPHTFHSKLGSHIVSNYRTRSSKTGGKHGPRYPVFDEFVRWLLCEWKAGNELDMHWTPIVNFCTPCQVRFDIIAKFETLYDDQSYLIKQAHVGHIIKPEWKNPTRGVQTKDVIKQYFAQLSRTQIKELYEMFRYDFILFDYSLTEYLEIGRDEVTKLVCKK